MSDLLTAEWMKMRRRMMPRVLIVITLGLIAVLTWGVGASNERVNVIPPRGWVVSLEFAAYFSAFIWPILGGSWAGSEYGWGTIRMVLSRRPSRSEFAAASLSILLLTALVTIILALIVATVAGIVVAILTQNSAFITTGIQGGYALILIKMALAALYVIAFYLVLSFAFGTIFRSSSVGIGVGIGLTVAQLIAVGIMQRFGGFWATAANHFPSIYLNTLIQRMSAEGTTSSFNSAGGGPNIIPECVVGIAVYMAILLVATFVVVNRRDVTS